MIYIVNYASGRFLESQRMQNARWASLYDDRILTICSFSRQHVPRILRGLNLENEEDIRSVLRNSRGDGLWAWKAIVTSHVYRNIARAGDIVFYMDSGACPILSFDKVWEHIRAHGHFFARVSAFETAAKVKDWLATLPAMQSKLHLLNELDFSLRLWTKPFPGTPDNPYGLPHCVLHRLDATGKSRSQACVGLLQMEQVCGGFQGYLKRQDQDEILSDLLANTSPNFFDDVVRGNQMHSFIDHRQDQSILSLIVNAECVRAPTFSRCIVSDLSEVCLHRGYANAYPPESVQQGSQCF